ncbi:MAG: aminotransferase class IV [Bacteroidetes bacterium]|jgi:branched-chain amino acid aminotransferase|nr:aminotransferase class IV [Bacteroidota bacterium]
MTQIPAQILLLNGVERNSGEALFTSHNRSFRYGDGLFESMRLVNGKLSFAQRHLSRLMLGVQLLQMRLPDNFVTVSLEEWCRRLAERNNITGGARVRLTIFRNDGGYYHPEVNDASWVLEMWTLDHNEYEMNDKGMSVELYQDIRKPINKLSSLKTANAQLYVLAALYSKQMNVDDAILINHNGNVIEATGSNLFAVKNGVLYTSPLSEGCVAGVMRSVIMEIAKENRIAVYEVPLPLSIMLNSDEVFLTNAVRGIQWISTYKAKRYFNNTAMKFQELLNKRVTS